MSYRDAIEAGSDLIDAEVRAAEQHLRDLLCSKGRLTGTTSYIQRKMQIGYNHAARILAYLEAARFITAPDDKGERELIA